MTISINVQCYKRKKVPFVKIKPFFNHYSKYFCQLNTLKRIIIPSYKSCTENIWTYFNILVNIQ